ncbi:MAG: right-handed parallel beta-helix repeat-containing protein [Candidatus Omnitrophica bacterium]|nr:right-handed parallel beta-helix repeat-containing protein [Candidatus Omnitrophota bacterium]
MNQKFFLTVYFVCLIFLLPATTAHAVTEFICTHNKTGEDYATMQAWENAMTAVGNLTAADVKVFSHGGITGTVSDSASVTGQTSGATGTVIHATSTQILIDAIVGTFQSGEVVQVSAGNSVTISDAGDSPILTLELYNDDGPITTNIQVNGLTTNTVNYWKITAPVGERHNGTAGTGVVIDPTSSVLPIYFQDDGVIEWIEITDWTATNNGQGAIHIDSSITVDINNVIIHDWTHATFTIHGIVVGNATANVTVTNSLIYNGDGAGIRVSATGGNLNVYNSTVYNMPGVGILQQGGTYIAKNVISMNNSPDFSGTFDASSDNNISSDGTAAGADLDSGTTDASGNTGATVVDAGQNFNTSVKPTLDAGEVAWFNNDTDGTSSKITSVDSDTQLTLAESGVTGNSKAFSINKSAYYRAAADQFVSLTGGSEDFHLIAGADALNMGDDLSGTFTTDIDNTTRPIGGIWDVGIDESEFGASRLRRFIFIN